MVNSSQLMSEGDYQLVIRTAEVVGAWSEIYDAMLQIALIYNQRGDTQVAADILAFLVQQSRLPADVRRQAQDAFEELETRICPRVIYDAKAFARGLELDDMLVYVLT